MSLVSPSSASFAPALSSSPELPQSDAAASLSSLLRGGLRCSAATSSAAGSLQPLSVQRRAMSVHLLTRLAIADNSGAKEIKCIGHVARKPARLGDAIRAVVSAARPQGRVSRKDIVCAVVVRYRAIHPRPDGSTVRFQENTAVLMKRDLSGPIGTRVAGPVARELRAANYMKVVMMASRVV